MYSVKYPVSIVVLAFVLLIPSIANLGFLATTSFRKLIIFPNLVLASMYVLWRISCWGEFWIPDTPIELFYTRSAGGVYV
jgi:hypothetical protein